MVLGTRNLQAGCGLHSLLLFGRCGASGHAATGCQDRESVALHIKQGEQRLCLFRVDSPQLLRDHVKAGDVLPLDRGAGGRVLMAFSGAKGKVYDKIRKDGYIHAVSDRVPGLVGVSAPVFKGNGQLVGALTLTVPESRFKNQFVDDLRASAALLCQQLLG